MVGTSYFSRGDAPTRTNFVGRSSAIPPLVISPPRAAAERRDVAHVPAPPERVADVRREHAGGAVSAGEHHGRVPPLGSGGGRAGFRDRALRARGPQRRGVPGVQRRRGPALVLLVEHQAAVRQRAGGVRDRPPATGPAHQRRQHLGPRRGVEGESRASRAARAKQVQAQGSRPPPARLARERHAAVERDAHRRARALGEEGVRGDHVSERVHIRRAERAPGRATLAQTT